MGNPFAGRDLISLNDFDRDEIEYLLDHSAVFKRHWKAGTLNNFFKGKPPGHGKKVCLIFFEDSTRTRLSSKRAAELCGFEITEIAGPAGTSLMKDESGLDTLAMIREYDADIFVVRHPLDGFPLFLSDFFDVPIVNAGDGKHQHPTQALLDIFTLREHFGTLDGLKIGFSGDMMYGRTGHSILLVMGLFENTEVHVVKDNPLPFPDYLVDMAKKCGIAFVEHSTLMELSYAVDALYAMRVQKERISDENAFLKAVESSCFTSQHMAVTQEKFILMHPLPNDKKHPSFDPELFDHPKVQCYTQAGNGVPTRATLFALQMDTFPEAKAFEGKIPVKPLDTCRCFKDTPIGGKRPDQVKLEPVRTGWVVDHARVGSDIEIRSRIDIDRTKYEIRSGTVESKQSSIGKKDMVLIEGWHPPDDYLEMVAAISPGAKVSWIQDGKVTRKVVLSPPTRIINTPSATCSNVGCVSRKEHYEIAPPRFVKVDEDSYSCYYCHYITKRETLFALKPLASNTVLSRAEYQDALRKCI